MADAAAAPITGGGTPPATPASATLVPAVAAAPGAPAPAEKPAAVDFDLKAHLTDLLPSPEAKPDDKAEAKTEEKTEPADALTRRMAALDRKQRSNDATLKQLQTEAQALQQLRDAKAAFTADPFAFMAKHGVTEAQAMEIVLKALKGVEGAPASTDEKPAEKPAAEEKKAEPVPDVGELTKAAIKLGGEIAGELGASSDLVRAAADENLQVNGKGVWEFAIDQVQARWEEAQADGHVAKDTVPTRAQYRALMAEVLRSMNRGLEKHADLVGRVRKAAPAPAIEEKETPAALTGAMTTGANEPRGFKTEAEWRAAYRAKLEQLPKVETRGRFSAGT